MDTSTLSVALRTATSRAHESAENSPFVTRLMSGEGTRADFVALTQQLQPVYVALEAALERYADHPSVAAVHDPALTRAPRLAADLVALGAAEAPGLLPATTAYIRRLEGIVRPEALLAHHYVRYLGDLSGGQIIARLVARHYDIPADGLSFYTFDTIAKPKVYKDTYRANLDALDLTPQNRSLVLAEAVEAFLLNQAVFADLERARGADLVQVAVGA